MSAAYFLCVFEILRLVVKVAIKFSSFRAFLNLENQDQNGTLMLATSTVVPPKDLQALYKNQVALPKGATNRVCTLITSRAKILIAYQAKQL